jgi:hypothetical protein
MLSLEEEEERLGEGWKMKVEIGAVAEVNRCCGE